MAIYIFNLLGGHVISGVEHAQGYRASLLRDSPNPVKFVFTELPERRDIDRYKSVGISEEQMLSMHQNFLDSRTLELSAKADDILAQLKETLQYTEIKYQDTEVKLLKDGYVVAAILLENADRTKFYAVRYFNKTRLIRTEFYTRGLAYVNYYVTAKTDGRLYAKIVRRAFYNNDGSVAYEQIWRGEKEWYIFPNGRRYTKSQLVGEFVKELDLSEKDIVFLDRGAQFDFVQPLFQFGGKARFMTFFHSGHYFEKGEDPWYYLYLNCQYFYWFKYSHRIDTMIVSTQQQKEELTQKLREYGCSVPNIEVIPVSGIEQLRYPETERKRYSLVSVSRINPRKKIDWIIRGVIKAHQKNPNIFIDIYGDKEDDYFQYLQNIVSANQAQAYVRFKGYMDVTEIYKDYEVYLSASLGETLGLSLMEAAASGVAMIGLDVKYGNRLFIQHGKNGYLIEYNQEYIEGDDSKLIDDMAEKIVEIFADEERLNKFHKASYEIAADFSAEIIADKWRNLLI